MSGDPWSVRQYRYETDRDQVYRLWREVSRFDASLSLPTRALFDAQQLPSSIFRTADWSVAENEDGVIVGLMAVGRWLDLGTELWIVVNPAWRRRGIGRRLLGGAPVGERLFVQTVESCVAGPSFLKEAGFHVTHRESVLRKTLHSETMRNVKGDVLFVADESRDSVRYLKELSKIEDRRIVPQDIDVLCHPRSRIFYCHSDDTVQGLVVVTECPQVKSVDLNNTGESNIGLIHAIGLRKSARGKGLSKPLVRKGLEALHEMQFAKAEVRVPIQRESALKLYKNQGFESVDTRQLWVRADDEVTGKAQSIP